jgi:hypothetical protein
MKLLFLRGHVPVDLNPKEIMSDSLAADFDVWNHLACALGNTRTEIMYWGGKRLVSYSDTATVRWVDKLKHYKPDFTPDVIFERGGFEEGRAFSKRHPEAYRIYYGSGVRYRPRSAGVKYDLVLVDSERQLRKARKHGWNAQLWMKPAAPQFKYMPEVAKEFDVAYVADGRFPFRAKIKNVDWFYKHAPKDLKILHLGWSGDRKVPSNITVKRVQRSEMPLWYNKCRVGIVPYTDYDSAPRVIPEMRACGLNVIVSAEVNDCHNTARGSLKQIWGMVDLLKSNSESTLVPDSCSIQGAAEQIKGYINAAK